MQPLPQAYVKEAEQKVEAVEAALQKIAEARGRLGDESRRLPKYDAEIVCRHVLSVYCNMLEYFLFRLWYGMGGSGMVWCGMV